MLRGYRLVVIAAFGLALANAQPPPADTQAKPQHELSSAAEKIAGPIKETTDTGEYQKSCGDTQDKEKSDLCAQWTAANAAQEAATYTKYAFFAAVIASFLALVALIVTVRGTKAAIEAAEAGRAWVCNVGIDCGPFINGQIVDPDGTTTTVANGFAFILRWKNCGTTPAIKASCERRFIMAPMDKPDTPVPPIDESVFQGLISEAVIGPSEMATMDLIVLDDAQAAQFVAGTHTVNIASVVRYRDVVSKKERQSELSVRAIHQRGTRTDPNGQTRQHIEFKYSALGNTAT